MMCAYLSEWLKIRRPGMILGGAGAMIGFAVLAVVLTLSRLGSRGGPGIEGLTAAKVAASDGFSQLMANSATFIGVIALAVCAVAIGTEYTNGTMRNLLTREPSRIRLLTGKLLAMGTFIAVAALIAAAASLGTAVLLASHHGISTSAWSSSAGLRSLASTTGNLLLSALAWGAVGSSVAMIFRSTTAAIAGGLAYGLVGEHLITAAWSGGKQWLPMQLIDAVARGGTPDVSHATALALVAVYVALALGASCLLFQRRDVAG
jgi:ABC-2 type transport system permease protein